MLVELNTLEGFAEEALERDLAGASRAERVVYLTPRVEWQAVAGGALQRVTRSVEVSCISGAHVLRYREVVSRKDIMHSDEHEPEIKKHQKRLDEIRDLLMAEFEGAVVDGSVKA